MGRSVSPFVNSLLRHFFYLNKSCYPSFFKSDTSRKLLLYIDNISLTVWKSIFCCDSLEVSTFESSSFFFTYMDKWQRTHSVSRRHLYKWTKRFCLCSNFQYLQFIFHLYVTYNKKLTQNPDFLDLFCTHTDFVGAYTQLDFS